MADEEGEKSEQPTDRKRLEVREQGNIPRSVDLNSAILMLATTTALWMFGAGFCLTTSDLLRSSLEAPAWVRIDLGLVMLQLSNALQLLVPHLIWIAGIVAGASLAINLAQVGFLYSVEAVQPHWSRINPWEGLQRIFSTAGTVKLAGSLLKLVILTAVAFSYVWSVLPMCLSALGTEPASVATGLGQSLITLGYQLAGALFGLAILDYGFQYWKFEQDLKMTKQEVREEMRNMEGDPAIRNRRREAHRKMAMSRQMQQVPNADVIITNPTELAIAVKYDALKMAAPVVLAKGGDEVAARIRKLAAEHGIPIVEKKPLARALYKSVKVGQAIPIDLYEAVAEVLAYVYKLKGKTSGRRAA